MVYDPSLPSLNSLSTEALFAFTQDNINLAWSDKSGNLDVNAKLGSTTNIAATMTLSPTIALVPGPGFTNVIQLYLTNFSSQSTLTVNEYEVTDLSSWTIVLQGPFTAQPLSSTSSPGINHKIVLDKLPSTLAVFKVVSAGVSQSAGPTPIDPNISSNLTDFTDLMAVYWNQILTQGPLFDLAYFGWPYQSAPGFSCVSWKTAADAQHDGTNDGIDRTPDPKFSAFVAGGTTQLVVTSTSGTTIPSPKNYVPLGDGAVLMIACEQFMNDQLLQAIFDAQSSHTWFKLAMSKPAAWEPSKDEVGLQWPADIYSQPPTWTFLPFNKPEEPTSDNIGTLNFDHYYHYALNIIQDHQSWDGKVQYKSSSTYTISASIDWSQWRNSGWTPAQNYALSVDEVLNGIDENGCLSFQPNGSWVIGPLASQWDLLSQPALPNIAQLACRFTGWQASDEGYSFDGTVGVVRTTPLPGAGAYFLSQASFSPSTYDFSAIMSYNDEFEP